MSENAEPIRAFARRVGVTEKAIRKALKSDRLAGFVGHLPTGWPCILNPEAAAVRWRETRRRAMEADNAVEPPASLPDLAESAAATQASASPPVSAQVIDATTLTEAQRLVAVERARKLWIENQVAQGLLVPVNVVAKEAFEADRIMRETLLNLPARIAGEIAALHDPDPARVHAVMDRVIREALNQVADRLMAANE